MNSKVLLAIQRFKDIHHKKNRNNDPILQSQLNELDAREMREYFTATEVWVSEQGK